MSVAPFNDPPRPTLSDAMPAALGALGDLFGRELRGLLAASMALAALLLGAGVWAAMHWGLPLIPDWAGWWGGVAEAAAGSLAFLVAAAISLALFPLVSMVVSGVFFDVAADRLEQRLLDNTRMGRPPSPVAGLQAGLRFASVSLPLNLIALPVYFIPVVGLAAAWAVNAFLFSRENYMLAGLRHGSWNNAMAELRGARGPTLLAAALPSALVLIPVANMIVPLWALATMVRLRAAGDARAPGSGREAATMN